jgi:hypothetical protein
VYTTSLDMLKFKDNNIKLFVQQAREQEDESIALETSKLLDLPIIDLTTYTIEYAALGTITEEETHVRQRWRHFTVQARGFLWLV